ncbi:hypothetical protein ACLBWX_14530 [Methylobacterium sp. M6A4_1b]
MAASGVGNTYGRALQVLGGIRVRGSHLRPPVVAHGFGGIDAVALTEQEGHRGRVRHEGVDRGNHIRLEDDLRPVEIAGDRVRTRSASVTARTARAAPQRWEGRTCPDGRSCRRIASASP